MKADPTAWAQLKAQFLAAVDQPSTSDAGSPLDNSAGPQRQELESLLSAHRAATAGVAETGLLESITGAASRGQRVGGWILGEPLGLGPLGRAYRAHDGAGRPAAVEVFEVDESRDAVARSLEPLARRLLGLDHPNLARTLEVGRDAGALWIAREEVLGLPLSRAGDLAAEPVARRLERLAEAADALATIHAAGLLHRDVSNRTIVVGPSGRTVLTDAGLVGLAPSGLPRATTAVDPPELARGGEASPAADLWALGAVLYEALCGVAPWAELEPRARARAAAGAAPPAPSEMVASFSAPQLELVAARRSLAASQLAAAIAPWDQVVCSCLSPDPRERPASAADLAARLRRPVG